MNANVASPTEHTEKIAARLETRFPQRLMVLPSTAQVAVRECGNKRDATTIVLLHGISSGAASWLQTTERLAVHARVLAWDAPGYGESSSLAALAPTDADYANVLIELLDTMGIQRCVLVGHSLGALVACSTAAQLGTTRIDRVVLISPAGGYGAEAQASVRDQVRVERRHAMQSLGAAGLAARIDQRLLSTGATAEMRNWLRWNTARLRPSGYLQAVEMLCTSSLARHLDLAMPVEVHCGDADVVTTPAVCREWAARFGAPFGMIKHSGHASPIEQPAAVAELIARATQPSTGALQDE